MMRRNKSECVRKFVVISALAIEYPVQPANIPAARLFFVIVKPAYPQEIHALSGSKIEANTGVVDA
jgi:hypothetical protein